MQLFTPIGIVCDHTMVEPATALRAVLESFRLRVDFYRMVQRRQVLSFFAEPPAQYAYTILWTHGSGSTAEDMHLAFEVVDQKEGNYQQAEGWEAVTLKLTPDAIAEYVRQQSGTLISTACGAGRDPLARAFLQTGYHTYIAPLETYYDLDAGLLFCINFFYYLLAEDRDYAPITYSEQAAFELAAQSDPDFPSGTRAFRYYTTQT
jgi:hypothetical protein